MSTPVKQRPYPPAHYDADYYLAHERPFASRQFAAWLAGHTYGPVLELGCGEGYLVRDLNALGVFAYGVDWSEYATSRGSVACGRVLCMDGYRTLFEGGVFSVVVSVCYLDHHPMYAVSRAIDESVRLLAYGGLAVHLIGVHSTDPTHQWDRPRAWYTEQFKRLGVAKAPALIRELEQHPVRENWSLYGQWFAGRKGAAA